MTNQKACQIIEDIERENKTPMFEKTDVLDLTTYHHKSIIILSYVIQVYSVGNLEFDKILKTVIIRKSDMEILSIVEGNNGGF